MTSRSLLVLLLAGCVGRISERLVLERTTPTTGTSGNVLDLEGDVLDVRGSADGDTDDPQHMKGIPLWPGDTIYLRRWAPGARDPQYNLTSPATFVARVPLRHVDVGAPLLDYERELLYNALDTNRADNFGGDADRKELVKAIVGCEWQVWNEFVEGLRVRRFSLQAVHPLTPAEAARTSKLVVTFQPSRLVEVFAPSGPCHDGASYEVMKRVLPVKILGGSEIHNVDILGVDTPPISPAHAMAVEGQEKPLRSTYYRGNDRPLTRYNFVTVVFNDVDLNHLRSPEDQWTLAQWEASDVCRLASRPKVRLNLLKVSLLKSIEAFYIARGEHQNWATHEVMYTLTQQHRVGREIRRTKRSLAWYYYLRDHDLDRLYITDVSSLSWTIGQKGRHDVEDELENKHNCLIHRR